MKQSSGPQRGMQRVRDNNKDFTTVLNRRAYMRGTLPMSLNAVRADYVSALKRSKRRAALVDECLSGKRKSSIFQSYAWEYFYYHIPYLKSIIKEKLYFVPEKKSRRATVTK